MFQHTGNRNSHPLLHTSGLVPWRFVPPAYIHIRWLSPTRIKSEKAKDVFKKVDRRLNIPDTGLGLQQHHVSGSHMLSSPPPARSSPVPSSRPLNHLSSLLLAPASGDRLVLSSSPLQHNPYSSRSRQDEPSKETSWYVVSDGISEIRMRKSRCTPGILVE